MEQIVKDKIDKAYEALAAKIKAHNDAVKKFEEEFFTSEINQLLEDYEDNHNGIFKVVIPDSGKCLHIAKTSYVDNDKRIYTHRIYDGDFSLLAKTLSAKSYDDYCIVNMKSREEELTRQSKKFAIVLNHAEDIARKIVEDYKDRNEKRNDELDNLLAQLDVENEPSKHIKITIEWV